MMTCFEIRDKVWNWFKAGWLGGRSKDSRLESRRYGRLESLRYGTFALVLLGLAIAAFGADKSAAGKGKHTAGDDLFAGTNVVRIRIRISSEGMSTLRSSGWGNGMERPVAKATVTEGGVVYTNVAVHLKGSVGSFQRIDENPALTLNFDKFAPGQSFHGLHKLSLNNSVQDRSYMSEMICRELFDAAGVPVPRAGHAKVELNGRDLGLHVLVEGANKQFLKRYFKDTSGNLYDGGFVQDITHPLSVNSGDNPKDNSGLRALVNATGESDPSHRFQRLSQVLDMDRFLSFLAMDIIQCNWDGYAMNRNNWRIFHDKSANRMVFIPHGLDQMFGVQRATVEYPILPRHAQGRVANAVLNTFEGKRQYLDRVADLYTNVFRLDRILQRIDEVTAVVNPVIAETSPQAARNQQLMVQRLKKRITDRDESLSQQLALVSRPYEFGADGALPLAGWRGRTYVGDPVFRENFMQEGKSTLYIGALRGETVGSWRTRLMLQTGTYRIEGRIRTRNIEEYSEGKGGAGLRISGVDSTGGILGTTEWRPIKYAFRVPEGGAEVEFVCELRAARGEVWFETESLKLLRLP